MSNKIFDQDRSFNRERRRFLDTMSKAGVSTAMLRAAPLLAGTFASRWATAADATNKRVIFMYLPNGAPPGKWLPTSGTEMNVATYAYKDVASVVEFRQVNMGQGGHGSTFRSMGSYEYTTKDTLDAHLAKNFPAAPYKVIRAGAQSLGQEFFTREAGQQATPIDGSAKLLASLFNGAVPTGNADDSYTRAFAQSRQALASLRKKLGADELARINTHEESLIALESRIKAKNTPSTDTSAACKTPPVFSGDSKHIVDEGKAVADIIVAALKCGLTNVATIQLSNDQAGWIPGTRVAGVDTNLNHHNFSHSGNDTNTAKVVGLLSEIPAYLIKQLMATNGPDNQPLINTTLFVQVSDMGDGNHGLSGAPFLFASKLPGFAATRNGSGSHKDFMKSIIDRTGLAGTLEA